MPNLIESKLAQVIIGLIEIISTFQALFQASLANADLMNLLIIMNIKFRKSALK